MVDATRDPEIDGLAAGVSWNGSLARAAVRARLFHDTAALPRFGRYTWLRSLGAGGMGTVVVGHDPLLDREVAIKLVDAADPTLRARVVHEAQSHARVTHPNVVSVFDVGVAGPRVYIVMELIVGPDLARWIAEGQPWRAVVDAWLEVAEGIAAVHAAHLVHRDVKPSNAVMGADGRARLIDFGVARAMVLETPGADGSRVGDADEQTDQDLRAGTPAYMAPEQLLGAEFDARAEQFSWCVSLWEALAGARPGGSTPALAALDGPWPPPAPAIRDVPRAVWPVLARGLAADPAERFDSMHALVAAVRRGVGSPPRRRRLTALALTGAAALAAWSWTPRAEDDACVDVSADTDGLWDASTRDTVDRHLAATAPSLHDAAWPRLDAAITDWVSAWDETRAQVCGDDEPDVAATRCLTWALADVRAIVDVLGRGDATALSRELDRAVSRPSPSRCREAAVVATTPPLAPEAIDDQVEEIRTRLRQAQRQREQGEYAVALAVAEAAMADASALDFPPLHMECGLAVGEAMAATGPYERAREVLEQTYAQADSAGYTVVAARAASQLAELLGTELRDAEGATPWTTRALAAARAAGDPALLSEAEGRVASTAVAAGKSAEARVLYEGLRARLTRECPAPCAQLVKVELELSWLLEEQGEHDAALQHAHAGLALAREVGGDGHLHTGAAHNRLCALLMRGGEYEAAKEQCTQGWTITRAVFGDEHTDTASSLAMLATVELTMGDAEAARPRLERAHAVFERILGPQHRQTQAAASNLALMAMYAGDYAAASRGFEAVLAAIEADPSASPAERITIHNALAEVRIKTGDFASAVHHLEQAIALGKAANHSGEALSRLRTRLGVALVELGRFAEAELVLGDAIAAESGVNAVYNGALRRCTLARAIADTDRPRALRLLDEALRQLGDEDPELAAQCRAQRERLRP